MKISSRNLKDGQPIDGTYAFCVPAAEGHVALSDNRSPHIAWSDLPAGTRSLVLICHDPDVPSQGDDVNQEGRSVPADLPRVDFFHWVLIDIDPALGELAEAAFSSGVTARGKPGPAGPHGTRQGINDYTGWFAGDPDMRGDYHGYDGPCPPWNDSIVHRYVFTLFATDLARCPMSERFTGQQVRDALAGHILGQAALTVRYSLNPAVPA
ncbi:MAG TPA: YbhB/YbcL family Raf kinase inhibitor-like protein [Denitromonas sp.]|uniref:YbhB/YbcL family Raf kinase inhibitor-like protein n=1 Tax=Denitromonas sp. TaxID=2734609 RepID=UPI001D9E4B10|nr:YbhB/YbcL family Raf kinase inhibitor-like protein [Rhodocyclaceae bacterium]MCP5220918.1 YbhB/YbcL family Raf kinase inhibitor-like protein [Zoogloeaceae bacterium]HPR06781.1 YbhB/YbcL family Raf kinase inhibitor-like protein [Denitromonas sp.]HQU87190.1 YbhB/YbcL family Raf kinase inhibitor-like protein [Denitromonas sp.]HQV13545.1 YbhB/YbcL family Raf kinase inhibitor-like protein [Denitromonas sp.]